MKTETRKSLPGKGIAGEGIRTLDVQLGNRPWRLAEMLTNPRVFNSLARSDDFRKASPVPAFFRILWGLYPRSGYGTPVFSSRLNGPARTHAAGHDLVSDVPSAVALIRVHQDDARPAETGGRTTGVIPLIRQPGIPHGELGSRRQGTTASWPGWTERRRHLGATWRRFLVGFRLREARALGPDWSWSILGSVGADDGHVGSRG